MTYTDQEEHDAARRTTEELEAEHSDRIERVRRELHLRVTNAARELDQAGRALTQLSVGDAWDEEYECGGPFADHLHEAQRVLKIAAAVIPTDAEGAMRKDTQAIDTYRALTQGSYLK